MGENGVRAIWRAAGTVINGWLAIPSSVSAEIMAHQGWDSLTIDLQHGQIGYQTALTMLQAISTTETVPMARVPWLEPGIVMKMLDAGALGLICPMIGTAEEAERFVGACRYPPRGYRSYGGIRAGLYGAPGYVRQANDSVLTFAMIETEEALANLEGILGVPGLDAVYVGPADLALALGFEPRVDPEEPRVVEAIERIGKAAAAHGLPAGIHCGSSAYAKKMIDAGFRLVTIASDSALMALGARRAVREVRGSGEH